MGARVRRFLIMAGLAVITAGLPAQASASSIIVGTPLQPGGGLSIFDTQWVAKAFTLGGAFDVSQVSVQLGGSSGTMEIYLTSALNSSSVLYHQSFASAAGRNDFGVGLTLGPGTYFIVLGMLGQGGGSWSSAGYSHIENGGTVGLTYVAYDPNNSVQQSLDSSWISQGDYPVDFEVSGTPVPEPSTLLLLGTGLTVVARRFRRKAQAA